MSESEDYGVIDITVINPAGSRPVEPPDKFDKLMYDALHPELRKAVNKIIKREAKSKAMPPESLSAYDVLQVVTPPYNLEALARLYEKSAAHNAAVTMKAINIVGLGYEIVNSQETAFKIERLQSKPEKLNEFLTTLKKERIKLYHLLESLNDEDEFSEMMVKVWVDVEATGNGYIEVGRTRAGKIGYIGHVPAHTIRIRAKRDGFVQVVANKYVFFRNYGDLETPNPLKDDPRPNELIHFKKYSPHSTYYGVPDIVAAMPAVLADTLAKEYNLDYFENKAVPRYAFITKGVKLSQESEQALKEYFRNELKGKHHGTLYIPLPGGGLNQNVDARFEQIEVRPQEQSFVTFIKESRLEVLMAHRVPPSKVAIYENTNLAVSRDADRTFKEQVCLPEQRRIEKKINSLFTEISGNDAFRIKFKQADIIDEDVKSRKHDRYLRTRVMKPNEVRAEIGLPSVPEGEEFLPVPGTFSAGNNPAPGKAEGNRRKTTDGLKPSEDGRPDRAERGSEQSRGVSQSYPRT